MTTEAETVMRPQPRDARAPRSRTRQEGSSPGASDFWPQTGRWDIPFFLNPPGYAPVLRGPPETQTLEEEAAPLDSGEPCMPRSGRAEHGAQGGPHNHPPR